MDRESGKELLSDTVLELTEEGLQQEKDSMDNRGFRGFNSESNKLHETGRLHQGYRSLMIFDRIDLDTAESHS